MRGDLRLHGRVFGGGGGLQHGIAIDGLGGEGCKPPMIGMVQGDARRPEDMDFQEGVHVVSFQSGTPY